MSASRHELLNISVPHAVIMTLLSLGSRSNSRLIRKPIKAKLGNMIRLMASSAFFPPGSNLVPTAANMKSRLAITITFECIELQGIFAGIDDKLVLFRSSNNTFSNDKRLVRMCPQYINLLIDEMSIHDKICIFYALYSIVWFQNVDYSRMIVVKER